MLKKISLWKDIVYFENLKSKNFFTRLVSSLKDEIEYIYPSTNKNSKILQDQIDLLKPNFIWTAGEKSNAIGGKINLNHKLISTHTDWAYQLIPIRSKSKKKFKRCDKYVPPFNHCKEGRYKIFKRADIVTTGSSKQKEEIYKLSKANAYLIPQVFPNEKNPYKNYEIVNSSKVKIYHIGGLVTTSNYIGLTDYLEKVHFNLIKDDKNKFELNVIGSSFLAKKELIKVKFCKCGNAWVPV